MKKKIKFSGILLFLALVLFQAPAFLQAQPLAVQGTVQEPAGWVKDAQGYRWRMEDGTFLLQAGRTILDGHVYYLDEKGYRRTGWVVQGRARYYMNPASGILTEGFSKIKGKTYYFQPETGLMRRGHMKLDKKYYYFDADGVRASGWTKIKDKWYYYDPKTGKQKRGALTLGGKRYYLSPKNGSRAAGWVKIGKNTCYYQPSNGVMAKSRWLTVNKNKYYVSGNGARVTGLKKIGGKQYYFLASGVLVKNKENYKIGNNYYDISSSGVLEKLTKAQRYAKAKLKDTGKNLRKAFDWCAYMRYEDLWQTAPDQNSETQWYACYGFENSKGNCYVKAATFCCMARELGYEAYLVKGYVPTAYGTLADHGWVELKMGTKWYVFDPSFHQTGSNGYQITYGQPGTWRYMNYYRAK